MMANINVQQGANTAVATINTILSVLNGTTPVLKNNRTGFGSSLNPFQFIVWVLQQVVGYDKIVNFMSETIVYGLPVIENAAKIALIESLKDLFSCSINPLISEDIIKYGVVLNLPSVDLLNIMERSPLENTSDKWTDSRFFYSDTENITIPDQLEYCTDLNAVIWFVKNRALDRTVWYGYDEQPSLHEALTSSTKPSKKDGIITMEFSEKSTMLTDCENNPMLIQVPFNNCLHIFMGNVKGVLDDATPEPSFFDILVKTNDFKSLISDISGVLTELASQFNETTDTSEQSQLKCEMDLLKKILQAINDSVPISQIVPNLLVDSNTGRRYLVIENHRIMMDEYTYTHTKNNMGELNKTYEQAQKARIENYLYRTPQQNYYYHRTLFEFNTDYIMSVKFFDAKVITAQIVNILTGCFETSLNLSFEERLIRNEVEGMLNMIIENGSATVSDCFFTFTNDEYNLLVDKTEKERIGKYSGDNSSYGTSIDYDTIFEELNKISHSVTLSEQVSKTNEAIIAISRTIHPEFADPTQLSANLDFIYNILRGLTLSLVCGVISPKIYMLITLNLKIMGMEVNFNISKAIELFKALLIKTIRGITDEILQQLYEWLLGLLRDLVVRLADRLVFEQAEYYMKLLTNCMKACPIFLGTAQGQGWNMANIEYADIYDENKTIENTSC